MKYLKVFATNIQAFCDGINAKIGRKNCCTYRIRDFFFAQLMYMETLKKSYRITG